MKNTSSEWLIRLLISNYYKETKKADIEAQKAINELASRGVIDGDKMTKIYFT